MGGTTTIVTGGGGSGTATTPTTINPINGGGFSSNNLSMMQDIPTVNIDVPECPDRPDRSTPRRGLLKYQQSQQKQNLGGGAGVCLTTPLQDVSSSGPHNGNIIFVSFPFLSLFSFSSSSSFFLSFFLNLPLYNCLLLKLFFSVDKKQDYMKTNMIPLKKILLAYSPVRTNSRRMLVSSLFCFTLNFFNDSRFVQLEDTVGLLRGHTYLLYI